MIKKLITCLHYPDQLNYSWICYFYILFFISVSISLKIIKNNLQSQVKDVEKFWFKEIDFLIWFYRILIETDIS